MVRHVVDKSVHLPEADGRPTLEEELRRAGTSLQLPKEMTLGYAIHILASVDEDREKAEKAHGERVIGVIEQFRARIHAVAEDRVKPAVKVASAPEPRLKVVALPVDIPAASSVVVEQDVVVGNSDGQTPADAALAIVDADPPLAPSPAETNGKLPADPAVWTAVETLRFLDKVDAREKKHGSLRRICVEHNIAETRYHYLKGQREKLQTRSTAEAASVASSDPSSSPPSDESSNTAVPAAVTLVAAPVLPDSYKEWNPAQIVSFVDYCAARPGARGSLAAILRTYNVPEANYHYWRNHREKYAGTAKTSVPTPSDLAEKKDPSAPPATGDAGTTEKPRLNIDDLKKFDALDEFGYLPEVIEDLGEMLKDPMLAHLAAMIRVRHAELVVRGASVQGTVENVAVAGDQESTPEATVTTSEPTVVSSEEALVVDTAVPEESKPDTDRAEAVMIDPPEAAALPDLPPEPSTVITQTPLVAPVMRQSLAIPAVPSRPQTPAAQIDDTRPKLFALVQNAPAVNTRTEDKRQKDYIISVTLRLIGSVKADWTFRQAVDFVCDRYRMLPGKLLEQDREFERQSEIPTDECHRLADAALRASADRYDPMVHGDLVQFLEQGIRDEFRKHPLFTPSPKREKVHSEVDTEAEKQAQQREALAMLWAATNVREEVYDYREFIGVIMRRHMAWVYPLAESLHDPDSRFPVRSLQNAGYQALKQAAKNFEFTDDVTYESFKEAVQGAVEDAIRTEIDRQSQPVKAPRPSSESGASGPVETGSATHRSKNRSPTDIAAGLLKMHLDLSLKGHDRVPRFNDEALAAFRSHQGIDATDHREAVTQLIARFLPLAHDLVPALLEGHDHERLFQSCIDTARSAIVRSIWGYDPASGDLEEVIRTEIETAVQRKIEQRQG